MATVRKSKTSHIKSFLLLFSFLFLYCLFGGLVFTHLDKRCERNDELTLSTIPNGELLQGLDLSLSSESAKFSLCCSLLESVKNRSLKENLSQICCEKDYQNSYDGRQIDWYDEYSSSEAKGCRKWTFHNVFEYSIFSFTAVTTIGYGDYVPKGDASKIVIIFYALFGIPIVLAMLTQASQISIHNFSNAIILFEKRVLRRTDASRDNFKVFIAALSSFLLTLIMAGVITTKYHGMNRLDAVYFWFVSITTIGFGDVHVDRAKFHDWNIIVYLLYIICLIFGIGLMASLFNIASELIVKGHWQLCSKCSYEFDDEIHENCYAVDCENDIGLSKRSYTKSQSSVLSGIVVENDDTSADFGDGFGNRFRHISSSSKRSILSRRGRHSSV